MKSDYFVLGYYYKAIVQSATLNKNYTFTVIAETYGRAENIINRYVAYPDKILSVEPVYDSDSGILIDKQFIK